MVESLAHAGAAVVREGGGAQRATRREQRGWVVDARLDDGAHVLEQLGGAAELLAKRLVRVRVSVRSG